MTLLPSEGLEQSSRRVESRDRRRSWNDLKGTLTSPFRKKLAPFWRIEIAYFLLIVAYIYANIEIITELPSTLLDSVIIQIVPVYITVEGVLIGLAPQIKPKWLRDGIAVLGITSMLLAVRTIIIATYQHLQLSQTSVTGTTTSFVFASFLFLLFVEFYAITILVPVNKSLKPDSTIKSEPLKTETMRFQTWTIFAYVIIITAILEGALYYGFSLIGSVDNSRIEPASRAIIELDSFVLGGILVGFFYFWERHESLWGQLPKELREGQPEPKLPLRPIPTVIGFVLSGLLAIGAILTVSLPLVEWALFCFVLGVSFGVGFWWDVQSILRETEKRVPPSSAKP